MAQLSTRDGNMFDKDRETEEFQQTEEIDVEPEETSGEDKITRPFNPTQIRVDTRQITIDLLLSRIEHEELDLNPNFQRKQGLWSEKTQSQLIESILVRIPLPSFYLDATDDEKWLVVDGLQRLTTLKRFMIDKELRLSKMEFLTELNGKKYDELPRSFQRRLKETPVTVYLIDKGTPSEVKFNIFKRINTGGLPLSPQEIRHALNQGKATTLLERLANSEEFQKATNRSIRDDRMTDRECVLRFFAFSITSFWQGKQCGNPVEPGHPSGDVPRTTACHAERSGRVRKHPPVRGLQHDTHLIVGEGKRERLRVLIALTVGQRKAGFGDLQGDGTWRAGRLEKWFDPTGDAVETGKPACALPCFPASRQQAVVEHAGQHSKEQIIGQWGAGIEAAIGAVPNGEGIEEAVIAGL